jgi:hypothetical protein
MSIKYRIEENTLKPGTFYARVLRGDTVHLDQMIPNVVAKTALTGHDLKFALSALTEEVAAALAAGNTVVIDGLVTLYISLSGSFDTPDYFITREMAQLNIVAQGEKTLKTAVTDQATYDREIGEIKQPIIRSFLDVATKTYDWYTSGSIVRLEGDNLKFNPERADEGVFVHDGSAETRLTVYSVAGKKQIDTLIPGDVSGALTVTVRARYTENGELRQASYRRQVTQL